MNQINQNKLNKFAEVYERKLTEAVIKFPNEYWYKAPYVPTVVAKMKAAFANGTYNKDGHGIKNACKELGIPYTYAGINAYLTTE